MKTFDAIIIGSGQGGNPLAKKLAKAGWKTVLIEKEHIGGTCINTGCTPSKTMIASAKLAYLARNAKLWGIELGEPHINMPEIIDRKNKIVARFKNSAYKGLSETKNLTLLFGTASFIDKKKLEINQHSGGKEIITADKIFIDTGASAHIPHIEGLDTTGYHTSVSILDLTEVPKHLLIIGAGYIGLEVGQMFARLGSKITILEDREHLLLKEDEDIAEEVTKFLKAENIEIFTKARTQKVLKTNGKIDVFIQLNDGEKTISCTHLLVATGRTANTESLHLSLTGVKTNDKGFIEVNDKLETSMEGIYALGDVKGGPQFTHISYNDHLIIYNNILNGKSESIANRLVPYCMFTDPQLGRVGLTEKEARAKGMNIKVAKLPMSDVARAIETGHTFGLMKAIVDADNGLLLGASILGEEGGEIMSVLQMAIVGKITYAELRNMIFAHPLYAESINNLFMQLDN